jgi:hypothetical protein
MEELHTDSIDGGHEASYGLGHVPGRGRTPTKRMVMVAFYNSKSPLFRAFIFFFLDQGVHFVLSLN